MGGIRIYRRLMTMKLKMIIASILIVLLNSCGKNIKPEQKDMMQNLLNQTVCETLIGKADYSYFDIKVELTDVKEKQYEFEGDKYGTYQGDFKYTFTDDNKSVKVMGVAVFSYDGSISIVNGCPGIFVDAIFVNSAGQKLEDSKYYISQCEWE